MGQAPLPESDPRAARAGTREVAQRGPHLPTRVIRFRLMRIDVNSFLGSYPYRRVPGTSPEALLRAMDSVGVDQAWVRHLPGIFWRDPSGSSMQDLARACSAERVPLVMAVRLEDARQRHPNDRAAELPPWSVRQLVRTDPNVRLIITHADRPFIEEVHFGSTPKESSRIWWDICWIWGPPEDHLETLLRTIGPERFLFGTGQPLRIPENSEAKLDLLDLAPDQRRMIEAENLVTLSAAKGLKSDLSSASSL